MTSVKSTLSVEQANSLSSLSAGNHPRLAERAQVVLLSAEGHPAVRVAERLGVTVRTVYKWRQRFQAHGLEGLRDRARPGQPRRLSRQSRDEIVRLTVEELPPEGQRWTIRSVARRLGVTQHQVRKVWSEHSVRPHLGRGALVEERLLGARGLRLRGLLLCPPCSVIVLQLEPQAGASARLVRRVLPDTAPTLHRILRSFGMPATPQVVSGQLASFLATIVASTPDTALHLLFPSRQTLTDPFTSQVLEKFPQVGASAKTSVALWADTVELWLEQTQKVDPVDPAIEALRQAMRAHMEDPRQLGKPFVWMRSVSVSSRSVGSVSVRTADL
ncbi:MAG: helix-turn-helix domain-containing protein [Myxococcales bacterium]